MREIFQEILDYTYANTLFNYLKLYHVKSEITEIVPDLFGTIISIDSKTNQLVSNQQQISWLQENLKIRFSGTTAIDNDKYFYVKKLTGSPACYKFSIGETLVPGEVVPLPTFDENFTIILDQSYIVLKDTSWLDLGLRIILEEFPVPGNAISQITELSENTKYYVYEIHEDKKIRLSLYQHLPNSSAESHHNFVHFDQTKTTKIELIQDNTFIEAVTEDKSVYLAATIDEKVGKFQKDFIMFDLFKIFNELENIKEYPNNSNLEITNSNIQNEFVSTKLNFENNDTTFKDEFVFLDHAIDLNSLEPPQNPMVNFNDTHWHFAFNLDETHLSRFDDMSLVYSDFEKFYLSTKTKDLITITGINNSILSTENTVLSPGTAISFRNSYDSSESLNSAGLQANKLYYVKTVYNNTSFTIAEILNGDTLQLPFCNFNFLMEIETQSDKLPAYNLEFEFGEGNPNFGIITFEQNITGTYIPRIIDEFKTITRTFAEYSDIVYRQKPTEKILIGPFLSDPQYQIWIDDTSILSKDQPIMFGNTPDSADAVAQAGLTEDKIYYVTDILDCNHFKFSETIDGIDVGLPYCNFQLNLIIVCNVFQVFDFTPFHAPQSNNKELWKYLKPDMPIGFRNLPDSSDALTEAELKFQETYYVKEIKKFLDGEEEFLVTGIDSDGILSLDIPPEKPFIDVLYPGIEVYFENLPDSATALEEAELVDQNDPYKKYFIKDVWPGGLFTLSETLDGEQLLLPYSNFEFAMKMDFVRLEFTISETLGGPVLPVPYSNFLFEVFHKVNYIEVDDTTWFRKNMPVKFETYTATDALLEASLSSSQIYYIKEIVDTTRLLLTTEPNGDTLVISDSDSDFFIKHATGNGLLLTSHIGIDPTILNKNPTIYTQSNLYTSYLDIIPNSPPYDHTFNNINLPIPADSTIFGQYYYDENDYVYGHNALSPVWIADYVITVTSLNEEYILTGSDRNGSFNLETMPSLTFYPGDKVEFNIDPTTKNTHPFWIKTRIAKKTRYHAPGSFGNGTTNIKWTVGNNGTYHYVCPAHIHMAGSITVQPSIPQTPTYIDKNLERAFDLRRPLNTTDLDKNYVYVFEINQLKLGEIKNNPTLTGADNEVKLLVSDRNSYALPVGFLNKKWIYPMAQILAIQLLPGDKVMRISDEGRLMITVKSPNGIYNYILEGIEKI